METKDYIEFDCDSSPSSISTWKLPNYVAGILPFQSFQNSHLGDCYIPYYDNASLLYDDIDGHFDYDKEVKKNPVFNLCLSETYNSFDKSIKHKQLNDMNNFFNQPNY